MNLAYLAPRAIRHFMPEKLADWMKKRKFIIKAGIETSSPLAAANRYQDALSKAGINIDGKTVMIFGYGGNVTTACELLKKGVNKIILCEREGLPFPVFNERLLEEYPNCFLIGKGGIELNSSYLAIIHQDIRMTAKQENTEKVDVVVSSSVFEHLDDVNSITSALCKLTRSGGIHFHFVDLRDHYFKYPFEMLTFSETLWKKWLNPTSNLNRLRISNYRSIFESYFSFVEINILESDRGAFTKVKDRIRKEFLTGEDDVDCATIISIKAKV
jgi:SAM-dependent methyltransferase